MTFMKTIVILGHRVGKIINKYKDKIFIHRFPIIFNFIGLQSFKDFCRCLFDTPLSNSFDDILIKKKRTL